MQKIQILWLYLAIVNLLSLVFCGIDKHAAVTGRWRIRESTLLAGAAIGGSLGLLTGMRLFHHKTRKPRFAVGVPVMLAIQAALVLLLIWRTRS